MNIFFFFSVLNSVIFFIESRGIEEDYLKLYLTFLFMFDPQKAHYIVVTGILVRSGKYLIVKRSEKEKSFPSMWTVPGGKLEVSDYSSRSKDAGDFWYNVFESALKREVLEETGLEIKNIRYLTSLSYIRSDGIPTIIVSMFCEDTGGTIHLCDDLSEFSWVSLEEAKKYSLIDGIYDELVLLDNLLKGGVLGEWKKSS